MDDFFCVFFDCCFYSFRSGSYFWYNSTLWNRWWVDFNRKKKCNLLCLWACCYCQQLCLSAIGCDICQSLRSVFGTGALGYYLGIYYCDREHFVSEIQYYPVDLWFSDLFSGILYHIHINMFVQYLLQLSKKILILFAWNIIEYRNHYYVIAGDNKRISVVYYNGTTIWKYEWWYVR